MNGCQHDSLIYNLRCIWILSGQDLNTENKLDGFNQHTITTQFIKTIDMGHDMKTWD